VSENEFNSCSSLITKYQINNSGIALAYPCCNYNSKESCNFFYLFYLKIEKLLIII